MSRVPPEPKLLGVSCADSVETGDAAVFDIESSIESIVFWQIAAANSASTVPIFLKSAIVVIWSRKFIMVAVLDDKFCDKAFCLK